MPSHPISDKLMEQIKRSRVKRVKAQIAAASDERIKQNEKLLGITSDPVCSKCDAVVTIFGHTDDCILRRINPDNVRNVQDEVRAKAKKDVNKQRVFLGSGASWSGVPGKHCKTLVRRGGQTKNRGPINELRYCSVCFTEHMFERQGGKWYCSTCKHIHPCTFEPNKPNCQLCFGG